MRDRIAMLWMVVRRVPESLRYNGLRFTLRYTLAGLLIIFSSSAQAAVITLQVTIGAANTKVISAGAHQNCRWIVIQNNAAHVIRIGDTNITSSRGILLNAGSGGNAGGSFFVGPDQGGSSRDLGSWYINGTQNDVVDVIYDDGQ